LFAHKRNIPLREINELLRTTSSRQSVFLVFICLVSVRYFSAFELPASASVSVFQNVALSVRFFGFPAHHLYYSSSSNKFGHCEISSTSQRNVTHYGSQFHTKKLSVFPLICKLRTGCCINYLYLYKPVMLSTVCTEGIYLSVHCLDTLRL